MASDTPKEPEKQGGLKKTFNKFNHVRHILMDVSMIGGAIAAFAATGGAVGFFDPIVSWAKMHVSGIPDLLTSAPDFLSSAFDQAQDGVFYTGNEASMNHGGHDIPAHDQLAAPNEQTHIPDEHQAHSSHAPEGNTPSSETASAFNHAVHQTPMEWFSTLPADEMLLRIEEANAVSMPFQDYIALWCENNLT